MKLQDNYKGKNFADISENIQKKYQDRFDPISRRGLMAEMGALRQEQEFKKAKEQARQMLEQQLQPQPIMDQGIEQPMQQPMMGSPDQQQQAIPNMPQEDQGNFQNAASQSYNEQFYSGGLIDMGKINSDVENYFSSDPFRNNTTILPSSGQESFMQPQGNPQGQGIDPMRFAPIASNLFGALSGRRAPSTQSQLNSMGFSDRVDEGLATKVNPRQTQFTNIDMSQIERGIQDQARGFSATNAGVSNGNAGQFMANEVGNQGNIMNAISNARLQGQQSDQRTQAMNAQEQGRIDSIKQQQAGMQAGIQGQNINSGMQMADLDSRNEGAFNNNRMSQIAGLATNLGSIGKESDQMKMISNALGYNSFGEYVASLPEKERAGALDNLFKMLKGI